MMKAAQLIEDNISYISVSLHDFRHSPLFTHVRMILDSVFTVCRAWRRWTLGSHLLMLLLM